MKSQTTMFRFREDPDEEDSDYDTEYEHYDAGDMAYDIDITNGIVTGGSVPMDEELLPMNLSGSINTADDHSPNRSIHSGSEQQKRAESTAVEGLARSTDLGGKARGATSYMARNSANLN